MHQFTQKTIKIYYKFLSILFKIHDFEEISFNSIISDFYHKLIKIASILKYHLIHLTISTNFSTSH